MPKLRDYAPATETCLREEGNLTCGGCPGPTIGMAFLFHPVPRGGFVQVAGGRLPGGANGPGLGT